MSERVDIAGSCHCGNVRIALSWPRAESLIAIRECGCSFCQKHGGAWTSHRDAELVIHIDRPSLVSKYRFGTETAEFYVCSLCGVVPLVLSRIDGADYAVVNVNTFDDTAGLAFDTSQTDFDGEDTASRLDRRRRNWIPSVSFAEGGAYMPE